MINFLLAAILGTTILQTPDKEKEVQISRANQDKAQIDGVLDEPFWQEAEIIPLNFETDPGNNLPAEVQTTLRVAFDDENFYFSFEAKDPNPKRIRAIINDRDKLDDNDFVSLFLDPFNDSRRAFYFSINPLGVQLDGVYDEQVSEGDVTWDAIWNSQGRITSEGYITEAAIPFKSLRFPNTEEIQTWRFFGMRIYPRSIQKTFHSMPIDQGNNCLLCQANLMTGLQGINPGRNLEFVPTVTVNRFDERADFPEGNLERGKSQTNVGLDVRWGITTDLALNLTLNPDFSQVEADAAQLDVNNRFSLQFPERRPFFLEGADFFNTPVQAFFSRTIADPSFGVKATGKINKNAMGLMVAQDKITNLILPGFQSSENVTVENEVTNVIGRFRRDIGVNSNVGVLYTGRESSNYFNRLVGMDFFVRVWKPLTLRAQYIRSVTMYADTIATQNDQPETVFGGDAFSFLANYDTRNWNSQIRFRNRSSGFRADAGFVPQVNFRQVQAWVERIFWPKENAWYRNIGWNMGTWRNQSTNGLLDMHGIWTSAFFNGPLQLNYWVNPDIVWQQFEGERYRLVRFWTGFDIQPLGNLGFNGFFNFGPAIDFENNRESNNFQFRLESDIRIGRHIDMTINHRHLRLHESGAGILTANLSQWQAAYNFNPRTFLRIILQYRHTLRDPDMFDDSTVNRIDESVLAQVLLSYKVNPQSVVFLGYVDNHEGWEGSEAPRDVPLLQLNQTLFFKAGYAWRP